ncbi:COG4223 family protein [Falsirhodobacter halotolerans]|uniref:COG4223 family protein n=1 Tax=Falsirhodobacter halotolerans TaxID=1146892 RepID=UPI001FD0DCA6|nr:hypothetical protein [Falsirhodobacter halotolerans]MCJ8140787.1 hypothetical protein [Falsirhodobacter halotolerans]
MANEDTRPETSDPSKASDPKDKVPAAAAGGDAKAGAPPDLTSDPVADAPSTTPAPAASDDPMGQDAPGPKPSVPPTLTHSAEPHAEAHERPPVFLPLMLGGIVAAVIGFGLARYIPGGWPIQDTSALRTEIQRQAQEITSLRDRVDALTMPDLAPLEERLTALEGGQGRIDDLQAQIEELRNRAPTASAEIPPDLQAAIDDTQRQLADARSEAERLRNEAESAGRANIVAAALSRIAGAVDGGMPFGSAVSDLRNAGKDVPSALSDVANSGVPTLAALEDSFPDAARAAIDASLKADGGAGWADRAGAFLRAQTGARSLTPREGNAPDAILSRAEAALRSGDLQGALREIGTLPLEGQSAMSDWRAKAEQRIAAQDALSGLASSGGAN